MTAGLWAGVPSARAQDKGILAAARSIKCSFPAMALGSWGKEGAEGRIKPATLSLQFDAINTDEGSAEMKSTFGGKYDIIVRYAEGYLHFIQSFLDGPLYTTTILEKKTADGKLKAMHSRHEFTDISLPGFTSSPEQYYGTCEILR
jgi:hypothetical protein